MCMCFWYADLESFWIGAEVVDIAGWYLFLTWCVPGVCLKITMKQIEEGIPKPGRRC